MDVTMQRDQTSTYMPSVVSSDPMRPRCDTIIFLALSQIVLKGVSVRFEHRIISSDVEQH